MPNRIVLRISGKLRKRYGREAAIEQAREIAAATEAYGCYEVASVWHEAWLHLWRLNQRVRRIRAARTDAH